VPVEEILDDINVTKTVRAAISRASISST